MLIVGTDCKSALSGDYYFGSIHTHPYPGGVPMFSWTDMFSLQQFWQNATLSNRNEIIIFLVCKDDSGVNQVYALTINNTDALTNTIFNEVQTEINPTNLAEIPVNEQQNYITAHMDKKLTDLYAESNNKELTFLNRFKDFGISLYKANSTLTNWDMLTIQNPNTPNASILSTPCN